MKIQLRQLKLFILVFSLITGLIMLYLGYKKTQSVSTQHTGKSQVTIIDLSKKDKTFNWLFLSGSLLLSLSIVLATETFLLNKRPSDIQNKLTGQEKTVASLIKQGKTNKEIAIELSISVSTVKTHINNMFKKLNIKSRSELSNLI